jgi:hypothetical protein
MYQAVLAHLEHSLWNDTRNARTLAWMVTGLVLSQRASLSAWLPHIHSHATFAQSTERRVRRWLENPAIHPVSIYGPLVTRALRDWGGHTLVLALDTSLLFEKFCLIRVSVLFRGRAVPLVSHVLEPKSVPRSVRPISFPSSLRSRVSSTFSGSIRFACWRTEAFAIRN